MSLMLSGCGGGTPFVGYWQCATDTSASLEITRYEDYFIITARDSSGEHKREGEYENSTFSVGSNNVGAAMALALTNDEIICTKPPNFCQCEGAYKKVDSLNISPNTASGAVVKKPKRPKPTPGDSLSQQLIVLDDEPITISLNNGGDVRLFDHIANADNEQRIFDWNKLRYYYVPEFIMKKFANGDFAEVRQTEENTFVFFRLGVRNLDKFELMDKIYESINTKIQPALVSPLRYEHMIIEIPNTPEAVPTKITHMDVQSNNGMADVLINVDSDNLEQSLKNASAIAKAINVAAISPMMSMTVAQTAPGTTAPVESKLAAKWLIAR